MSLRPPSHDWSALNTEKILLFPSEVLASGTISISTDAESFSSALHAFFPTKANFLFSPSKT